MRHISTRGRGYPRAEPLLVQFRRTRGDLTIYPTKQTSSWAGHEFVWNTVSEMLALIAASRADRAGFDFLFPARAGFRPARELRYEGYLIKGGKKDRRLERGRKEGKTEGGKREKYFLKLGALLLYSTRCRSSNSNH